LDVGVLVGVRLGVGVDVGVSVGRGQRLPNSMFTNCPQVSESV
jgi:hypothetical protein